ncbi:MAG TPA: hypothetical protein VMD77_13020 [Candidatus Baltobacteraceae bacterium]|nr:hypothetical protein [Candidatus Baltobacteraceae bacterium]
MRDVSSIFDHFRISAWTIWNTAFWPLPDLRNWDSVDRFDGIQRALFDSLVLVRVDREWPVENIFRAAMPFFHVVPKHDTQIMIQNPRSDRQTGYWDHPVKQIKPGDAELHFIAYFDWDRMDYADLRYYRAQITKFEVHSGLVGREVLIETSDAKILVSDE